MEINSMNKYLLRHSDGHISILIIKEGTVEGEIAKYSHDVKTSIISYRSLSDVDIPNSREFRNAWCDISQESKIDIHADKARNILLDNVREQRKFMLESLDKDFIIALENNDQVKLGQIKTEKNRLRAITDPLKNLTVAESATDADIAYMKSLAVL